MPVLSGGILGGPQSWRGLLGFGQEIGRRLPGILQNGAMGALEAYQEAKPRVEQARDAAMNRLNAWVDPSVMDGLRAGPLGPDPRTDAAFRRMRQTQVGFNPRPTEVALAEQAQADPTLRRAQSVVDDKAEYRRNWEWLQGVEGGDVLHKLPDDSGGWTRWGIAENYNPDFPLRTATEDDAVEYTRRKYWVANGLNQIAKDDPVKAAVLFDGYYHLGAGNMRDILARTDGSTDSILAEMRRYREAHPNYGAQGKHGTGYVNRQNALEGYVRRRRSEPPRRRG